MQNLPEALGQFIMNTGYSRRHLLVAAAAAGLFGAVGSRARPTRAEDLRFGPATPFDFDIVRAEARGRAASPHQPPVVRQREILETIDYDVHQQIRFRSSATLWAEDTAPYPVQFFHPGRWFEEPVEIHVVEAGQAQQILYSRDLFDFGDTGLDGVLSDDLGFAGFRLMDGGNLGRDWLSFLGASYFRSAGPLDQYGLSARGIAVNTGLPVEEEFPQFIKFWLERPAANVPGVTIHALLDGPSLAGAYRFDVVNNGTITMDVRAELFARTDITQLGIAPLTSMFWYGENNRHRATDWRPEVHDSDGLAIWTGEGERLWRPLDNPSAARTSAFLDANPRGFGLLQRDRAFANYEDDGVYYDRRPSVWVEPLHDWGPGAVHLLELPTDDEIHDNIGAYWVPETPVTAGSDWAFAYRLHWVAEEPYPPQSVARVVSTRLGRGGVPGQPRPENVKKFVVDFLGGALETLPRSFDVLPIVTASRGAVTQAYAVQIVDTTRWRAVFDLAVDGPEPVDLRCFLRLGEQTLSETWLYHYVPFSFDAS